MQPWDFSRRAFDIDGLGEKQLQYFFDEGWVKEPADIFTLPKRNNKLKLEEIEGYGETSVRKLFAAIAERRRISLERFIFALGMRHVGETTALALARGYGSWKAFPVSRWPRATKRPLPRWMRSTRSVIP